MKMALHIPIKVVFGGLDQTGIVDDVVPILGVRQIVASGSADDDASVVWTRDQVVVERGTPAQTVGVREMRSGRTIGGRDDATAYAADRHDLALVLRREGCSVGVGGEDDSLRANRATGLRGDGPSASGRVWHGRDIRDGRVCLQVDASVDGEPEEVHDQLVRPQIAGREAETAFGVFDSRDLQRRFISSRLSQDHSRRDDLESTDPLRGGTLRELHVQQGRHGRCRQQSIVAVFDGAARLLVQLRVDRTGDVKVAVDLLLLDDLLQRRDVGHFELGELGGRFETMFSCLIDDHLVWTRLQVPTCSFAYLVFA